MSLQIEGIKQDFVSSSIFIAREDYFEEQFGQIRNVYYYDDIEGIFYEKKGLLNKSYHFRMNLDDGYNKFIIKAKVTNDYGNIEEFCDFINQKSQNKRPEMFLNTQFNTNMEPETQLKLLRDYYHDEATMMIFREGIQIFKDRRISYIKYSQMQRAYSDENKLHLIIQLRTNNNIPKIIDYTVHSKLLHDPILPVIDYINSRIHQEEQKGNIETLNTSHTVTTNNPMLQQNYRQMECYLIDERSTTYSQPRQQIKTKCKAVLKEEYLEIQKESEFMGNDRGQRRVYYAEIIGIDYDSTTGHGNAIEIMVTGADRIILECFGGYETQSFYELLSENVNKIKEQRYSAVNSSQQQSMGSDADELTKWYNLYQQGVISKDEFENKKRKFLD